MINGNVNQETKESNGKDSIKDEIFDEGRLELLECCEVSCHAIGLHHWQDEPSKYLTRPVDYPPKTGKHISRYKTPRYFAGGNQTVRFDRRIGSIISCFSQKQRK